MARKSIPRLEVYLDCSVLVQDEGRQIFKEGHPTGSAERRLARIRKEFENGFLDKLVGDCRSPDIEVGAIDEEAVQLLTQLVDSVTSEVGRAIVGLTVLQLAIKSICPGQSIRLHKGGGSGDSFSWEDGLPMRVLDKEFNTPVLRKYDLVKLNADGVFMTRSLAENYPYSQLYKAASRGAKTEWLAIVDLAEFGKLDPTAALKQLVVMLFNRSDTFKKDSGLAMHAVKSVAGKIENLARATKFIRGFVDSSTYAARLFEIAMHSLFQVLEDHGAFLKASLKSYPRCARQTKNMATSVTSKSQLANATICTLWSLGTRNTARHIYATKWKSCMKNSENIPKPSWPDSSWTLNPNLKSKSRNVLKSWSKTTTCGLKLWNSMIGFHVRQSGFHFRESKLQVCGLMRLRKVFVRFAATVRQLTSRQILGFVSFAHSPKKF